MSITLEGEDLVPHLERIETDQQFPHAVLGPDLRARAMSEPGDAYVLAPPLQEGVFEEEVGFSSLRDLVAACKLAREGRYSDLKFSREGPDLVVRGTQEDPVEVAIQTALPPEIGTNVSPERSDELRSRLDGGQAFPVTHGELNKVVEAHGGFGVGTAAVVIDDLGARVRIGKPGSMSTVPLRSVEWNGEEPFTLEVTSSALASAAKTVPEGVDTELILEGPSGHLGLQTDDGYLYAFPHMGE